MSDPRFENGPFGLLGAREGFFEVSPEAFDSNGFIQPELIYQMMQAVIAGRAEREQAREEQFEADLYAANAALGEYCIDQEIDDVVFLDRSARPIWNTLSEYLSLAHPDAKKPGFHFLSPDVINGLGDNRSANVGQKALAAIQNGMNRRMAKRELTYAHNDLLDRQDSRVLVMDICVHSGQSLQATKQFLNHLGINDVKTGAFTVDSRGRKLAVDLDFSFTDDEYMLGCRPYGNDPGLRKAQSMYVRASGDSHHNYARHEARQGGRELIRDLHEQAARSI
jgi:hypothetical protein